MATEVFLKKSLTLRFDEGMDDDGKAIFKQYSYQNVKNAAAPDKIEQAAQALASLYGGRLSSIVTTESSEVM